MNPAMDAATAGTAGSLEFYYARTAFGGNLFTGAALPLSVPVSASKLAVGFGGGVVAYSAKQYKPDPGNLRTLTAFASKYN